MKYFIYMLRKNFSKFKTSFPSNTEDTKRVIIAEIFDVRELLKPLIDKLTEIRNNKGGYSLICCILEIFYDKKINILKKSDILNEIKEKIKSNYLIFEAIDGKFNLLNYKDCSRVNKILEENENFSIFYNNRDKREVLIQINKEKINLNYENMIKELSEINYQLENNMKIVVEIEARKNNRKKIKNNKKEIKSKVDTSSKEKNNTKENNNKINNNIKEEIINKDISSTNTKKKYLEKKRKVKNNYLTYNSNKSEDLNGLSGGFSNLYVDHIALSYTKLYGKKIYYDKIDEICSNNEKIVNIFGKEGIENIEENKIKELNKEIEQKNKELKSHEFILKSLKKDNPPHKPKKNNIIILTHLIEEIKNDYIEYKKELKLLSLYKKIINTYKENNNDNDNDNDNKEKSNIEELRNMYNNSFNNCIELIKKIINNKDMYLSCLNNLKEFIKLVNNINTNKNENIDENIIDNDKSLLYIQEKDYIEKIISNLDQFIETLNYNLNQNILDSSLKKELNL